MPPLHVRPRPDHYPKVRLGKDLNSSGVPVEGLHAALHAIDVVTGGVAPSPPPWGDARASARTAGRLGGAPGRLGGPLIPKS